MQQRAQLADLDALVVAKLSQGPFADDRRRY